MDKTSQEWARWGIWTKELTEESALTGMQSLQEVCASCQKELDDLEKKHEGVRQSLQQKMRNDTDIINGQAAREKQQALAQEQQVLEKLEHNLNYIQEVHRDLKAYLESAPESNNDALKYMEGDDSVIGDEDTAKAFRQQDLQYKELCQRIETQKKRQQELTQAILRQIDQHTGAVHGNHNRQCKMQAENNRNSFLASQRALAETYINIRDQIAGSQAVRKYIDKAEKISPDADDFVCADQLPEYIRLGSVSMKVSDSTSSAGKRLLEDRTDLIHQDLQGNFYACLPYCQKVADGISLFVSHPASARAKYHKLLQDLLLNLFMAFPPARLEALMIDPMELGETFTMFTRLGKERPRITTTKAWSQERDITEQIKILRDRVETITQTYGNDSASRMKKEPSRVLAITDFPTGFSQEALQDLRAIVRKSASCGVCVLIWADESEMKKLKSSQQEILEDIQTTLHMAIDQAGRLILQNKKFPQAVLDLTGAAGTAANSTEIIKRLAEGIHNTAGKKEPFGEMFDFDINDANNWFSQNSVDELSIPLGIQGADTVVRMVMGRTDGSTAHHALIAGETGAGKSTLLHTIVMSTLLNYYPDEVQMYLVDFKEGVEFKAYSRLNLPSIRMVAIDCEREFALNILKALQKEMRRRFELFRQEAGREQISDYRKVTGKKIPKLLVIFDELQELFRPGTDDMIGRECSTLLGELLTLGRAAGIHFVLASQNFDLIAMGVQEIRAHSAIRIAIKGSDDSANSVLGSQNDGAAQLKDGPAGAAIFNDDSGKQSVNKVFQVAYLEREKRTEYLNLLSSYQNNPAFAEKYPDKTRVLLTSVEDDAFGEFSQIIQGVLPAQDETEGCRLLLGEGFDMKRRFRPALHTGGGENLLMVGMNEQKAASLFYFSILSTMQDSLYGDPAHRDDQNVWLIDLSLEEDYEDEHKTSFTHLKHCFGNKIGRARLKALKDLVDVAHSALERRMDGLEDSTQRRFLMFFGVDRAHKLLSTAVTASNMYSDAPSAGHNVSSKLTDLMQDGPRYGISCVFWGETLKGITDVLGNKLDRNFSHRIVFSSDKDTYAQLVMEQQPQALRQSTAVYMNVEEDVKNKHFRPYEIPGKNWVKTFSEACRKL